MDKKIALAYGLAGVAVALALVVASVSFPGSRERTFDDRATSTAPAAKSPARVEEVTPTDATAADEPSVAFRDDERGEREHHREHGEHEEEDDD